LDGANHNNSFENTYLSMPFPDAMQEFKVETSATAVQNGVRPAGSVSLVTKSGTNDFHGDLFEFVRNGMFNARNAFATKRDTITRRGAFVNSRVDPSQISKAAVGLQKLLPQTSDPCGKTIFGTPVRLNSHMAIGRIDYQKSDKNSIFGRYLLDSQFSPAPYSVSHNILSAKTLGIDALTQAFSIGETYLVNANIVNSVRLTANRWVDGRTGADSAGWNEMGVKALIYV